MLHRSFPKTDIDRRLWTPLFNRDKNLPKIVKVLPGVFVLAKRLILRGPVPAAIDDRFCQINFLDLVGVAAYPEGESGDGVAADDLTSEFSIQPS